MPPPFTTSWDVIVYLEDGTWYQNHTSNFECRLTSADAGQVSVFTVSARSRLPCRPDIERPEGASGCGPLPGGHDLARSAASATAPVLPSCQPTCWIRRSMRQPSGVRAMWLV